MEINAGKIVGKKSSDASYGMKEKEADMGEKERMHGANEKEYTPDCPRTVG